MRNPLAGKEWGLVWWRCGLPTQVSLAQGKRTTMGRLATRKCGYMPSNQS
jgi:hypothetical protein